MEPAPTEVPSPAPAPLRVAAALALAAGLVVAAGCFVGPWRGQQAPFPFVWLDVAVVHLLCALPLAVAVAAFLTRRLPAAVWLAVAAFLFGVAYLPLLGPDSPEAGLGPDRSSNLPFRAGVALGVATPIVMLAVGLIGGRLRAPAAAVALGVVVVLLVPWAYVRARCRHDEAKLAELLEQSRLGEARALANALLAFDPEAEWTGRPLSLAARAIDRAVRGLEERVAAPLGRGATDVQRLDRARALAMLDRTDEALGVLEAVSGPDADNLRGTIREARGEWDESLAAYRGAKAAWQARPPSGERDAGLLRATTGEAYCQRKRGRYDDAEAAYLEALALAPTAETHFLLAQFYDDAQHAEKARAHARRAIELAPARYGQQGEKLIRKLTVFQFGCLGVYNAEREAPRKRFTPGLSAERP